MDINKNQSRFKNISKKIEGVIYNPKKMIFWSNRFLLYGFSLVLIALIAGYIFSLNNISINELIIFLILLLYFIALLFFGNIGIRKGKVFGKLFIFLAYLPLFFVFPAGTVLAAWIFYSLYKLKK